MKSLNAIEFSCDSETAVVGGNSGGKCLIAAMPVKVAAGGAVVQYIEKEDNGAPTVISRLPGFDFFLAGVGQNVYVYSLEKNLRLKRVHKIGAVAAGIINEICIKGNVAYVKGNGENVLNVLLFGAKLPLTPQIPKFAQKVMRQHPVNLAGNLEKVWVDPFNNTAFCGGGFGLTGLKKDKLTGQLVQVRAEVARR